MDAPFPFGFPIPTGFYLVLYVLTLVIHVVFMNYVIAGTGYLAIARILTRRGTTTPPSLISRTLTDWMPLALSAAITAGVAPLLFIQILYKHAFYTANLLLFHRWMAILPVLIVGFYLLYVWKSRPAGRWPVAIRAAIGVTAFACFAFTGFSWTENHVLSKQAPDVWAAFYTSDAVWFHDAEVLPRLAVWYVGSIPTMALLVAWQLRHHESSGYGSVADREVRHLATVAVVGLVLAAICGWIYLSQVDEAARHQVTGPMAQGYLYAAVAGLALQAAVWGRLWLTARLTPGPLTLATLGLTLTLVGMSVVRGALRLGSVDITALYEEHAEAARVGGLPVFLIFAVATGAAIALCGRMVGRNLRANAAAPRS
jgi:hypothetical protein